MARLCNGSPSNCAFPEYSQVFKARFRTEPANVFNNLEEWETQRRCAGGFLCLAWQHIMCTVMCRGLRGHGSSSHWLCRYIYEGKAEELTSAAAQQERFKSIVHYPDKIAESKRWDHLLVAHISIC